MARVLDLHALRDLREIIGGSDQDLKELVDEFIDALPLQFEQMRDASMTGELTRLKIAAHSCKSNSRDLGALGLSEICSQLETAAAIGNSSEIPDLIEQISEAIPLVLSELLALDVTRV